MRAKGPATLLTAVASLAAAAGALLVSDSLAGGGRRARAAEFQRLVGGLGFGPALDLGRCPFSFDPRLGRCCGEEWGPVPGGVYFCPQHAASVFFYPPLAPRGEAVPDASGH
jgi:hypothetical protein